MTYAIHPQSQSTAKEAVVIKKMLRVESKYFFEIAKKHQNSRTKYFAKILELAGNSPIEKPLPSLYSEEKAFRTETAMENRLLSGEFFKANQAAIKDLERKIKPFFTSPDEYVACMAEFIQGVVESYAQLKLCFASKELFEVHKEKVKKLHQKN